jgi:hypothetical protein
MTRSYTTAIDSSKIDFLVGLGKDALGAALSSKVGDFRFNPSCSLFQDIFEMTIALQEIVNRQRAAKEGRAA